MAKTTWIPPRFKNQLHCGIVAGGGSWGWSQVSQPGLDLITVAPNCHGKTKNLTAKTKYLTAKPKTSRQKQKPHCKNKIPQGKTKYFTAKTKYLTRQKQIPTAKPKLFCFCREVFDFVVTVVGHHKFAIASNVRIYAVNGFRRVGEAGGGGFKGFGRTPFGT